MTCTPFTTADGSRGFVCSRTRRAAPKLCQCGQNASTLLCDWRLPRQPGKRARTCDAPLCDLCTTSPAPEKDLCPTHAAEWAKRTAFTAPQEGAARV